jgi:hypothetical protein
MAKRYDVLFMVWPMNFGIVLGRFIKNAQQPVPAGFHGSIENKQTCQCQDNDIGERQE